MGEATPLGEIIALAALSAFCGGLFGGFFAFLFEQLGARIQRHRKRWVLHHNALVRLEHYCNLIFSINPDNTMQFSVLQRVCRATGTGPMVSWSQPSDLPYDPSVSDDLLCLYSKNLVFGLQVEIRRFNHAVKTVNHATTGLHDAWSADRISTEAYRANMKSLGDEIDSIQKFINLIDDSSLEIAAHTRLLLRKDAKLRWWRFWSLPTPSVIALSDIAQMREVLTAERNETGRKSRKELDKRGIKQT